MCKELAQLIVASSMRGANMLKQPVYLETASVIGNAGDVARNALKAA